MQGDRSGQPPPAGLPDGELWQRSRMIDAPADEAERYLELAAFADGRLDADERERVADWLERDPAAASDIAAARALADRVEPSPAVPEDIIARACALVSGSETRPGQVIPFPIGRVRPSLPRVANWAALVAATVLAGWVGFALGMDTSRSLAQRGQVEDSLFNEAFDPPIGLLRDFGEGSQS